MKYISILFLLFTTCSTEVKKSPQFDHTDDPVRQVSQYIRRMFQDKSGNIWFCTNGDGVCKFDGKDLVYFSLKEGFGGETSRGVVADKKGNLWFATNGGVTRYDGKTFRTFSVEDGLNHNEVWSILLDNNGTLWVGTEGGTCTMDISSENVKITKFVLPVPDLSNYPEAYHAPELVHSIIQDRAGNIWFATNGGGVYRYDFKQNTRNEPILTHFTEKEGLVNNFVQFVFEDNTGTIWMGTRFGGLSRYSNGKFSNYTTQDGLSTAFLWTMMQDRKGKLWVATAGGGLMRFSPSEEPVKFTCFGINNGLANQFVQSLLQDRKGDIWIGTSGGVFRYEEINGESRFVNFTNRSF